MKNAASRLLTMLLIVGCIQAQNLNLLTQSAQGTRQKNFAQSQSDPTALAQAGDTLEYFFNKHYFRNPTTPTATPANLQFLTITSPYPGTVSIDHLGSIFLNTASVTVTGLEGLVMRHPTSTSTATPVKFYLCNVSMGLSVMMPPLDSVVTTVSTSTAGVWVGANFANPVGVTGNFAVLFNVGSYTAGDTIRLFLNNACNATSTVAAAQRFGEGLGLMRYGGTFYPTTGVFSNGPTGNDYEFIVAPRLNYGFSAGASANTSTICTNSVGSFVNTSSPMSLIENRQFNFNKFGAVWGALCNTIMPTTDSIYNWTFSGSTTGPLTTKNANAFFNVSGTQSAFLNVKCRKNSGNTIFVTVADNTSATINVSSTSAPSLAITGNSSICSGSSTTLTASGNPTFTWTSPPSNNAAIVVSPTANTAYTVSGVNGACVGMQTVMVTVAHTPTVTVTGPSAICVGASSVLTASGAGTYSWSTSSTGTTITVSSTSATVLSFTATGFNAPCPSSNAVKQVTINALPGVTLTVPSASVCTKATGGGSVQLSGQPTGGQYSGSGITAAGVFTPNNAATVTANYSFTNTATGCKNTASKPIYVVTCTGLNNNGSSERSITVYPNPAQNGIFNISNLEGTNTIEMYNLIGQKVFSQRCTKEEISIDISDLPNGTYIIRVIDSGGGDKTLKIVNQN